MLSKYYYPRRLCCSMWVEWSNPSVSLFVRIITQKQRFKHSIGNDLGYPRNDMVLGLKGQGHGINTNVQSITHKRMIPNDIVFWVSRSQVRVRVLAIAIRRGFKLYECLLEWIWLFTTQVEHGTLQGNRQTDMAANLSHTHRHKLNEF